MANDMQGTDVLWKRVADGRWASNPPVRPPQQTAYTPFPYRSPPPVRARVQDWVRGAWDSAREAWRDAQRAGQAQPQDLPVAEEPPPQDPLAMITAAETPDALGAATVAALRMAWGNPEGQMMFQQYLSQLREAIRGWDAEQLQAYRGGLTRALARTMNVNVDDAETLAAAEEVLRTEVGGVIDAKSQEVINAVTSLHTDPAQQTGFGEWITQNWQTLLVPGGALLAMFGGRVGQVLGVMAMGVGGFNLMDRYNRLTNPGSQYADAVGEAVMMASQQTDSEGNLAPFSDRAAIAQQVAEKYGLDPRKINESLTDLTFLASMGYHEQIAERIRNQADQTLNMIMGTEAPPERPSQPWTENVSDMARGAMGKVRGWFGGGQPAAQGAAQ